MRQWISLSLFLMVACSDRASRRSVSGPLGSGETTIPPSLAALYEVPKDLPPPGERVGPDTHSCLELFSGPMKKLSQQGEAQIQIPSWEEQARFDLRGGVFKAHMASRTDRKAPYTIQLGIDWGKTGWGDGRIDRYHADHNQPPQRTSACIAGGVHIGTQPRATEWVNVKHGGGGAPITLNGTNVIMDGMRIDNHHDGYLPYQSVNPIIRHNWISHTRDDCIENDAFAGGLVIDNLFDGCYAFYSGRNKPHMNNPKMPIAPDNKDGTGVLRIVNNLIFLKNQIGANKTDGPGYLTFWKTGGEYRTNPRIDLINNVFAAEPPATRGTPLVDCCGNRIRECRNNVVLWLGDDDYPHNAPKHCFKIFKGAEARAMWDRYRTSWIENHPKVAWVKGDPAPRGDSELP